MKITMRELARLAGVSRPAVSAVLNNSNASRVSAEKRELILHLARTYHYRPNLAAIRLNGKPSRMIGIILDDLTEVGDIRQKRLSTLLHLEGYTLHAVLFTGVAQACDVIRNFISSGVDAVIFPSIVLEQLRHEDLDVPIVIYGREIDVDYGAGTEQITRHLIKSHGHRKILTLTTEFLFGAKAKYEGYARAMRDAGLKALPVLESIGNRKFDSQLAAYLRSGVTAFVTFGDVFAAQLIAHFRARGIRVPEDVAVTGFDATGTHPEITSVADPAAETAEEMARLILKKISGELQGAVPIRLIRPGLYIGTSCGCPPVKRRNFAFSYESNYSYESKLF